MFRGVCEKFCRLRACHPVSHAKCFTHVFQTADHVFEDNLNYFYVVLSQMLILDVARILIVLFFIPRSTGEVTSVPITNYS